MTGKITPILNARMLILQSLIHNDTTYKSSHY